MSRLIFPSLLLSSCLLHAEPEFESLFDGKSLDGWEIILADQEVGEDPKGMVTITDGTIHMYENIEENGEKVPFGVIMTEQSYSQFVLTFEYRWLGKRFPPRAEKLRDAGLLYHCYGEKKVWPPSIECQVQEGDTGDIIFIESAGITWKHHDPSIARKGQGGPGQLPEYGGVSGYFTGGYYGRLPEYDKKTGWTRVDAVVHRGEASVHLVNGNIISRVADMRRKDDGTELHSGPIALQLEAAELQYRDIRIKQLDGFLRPSVRQLSLSKVGDLASDRASVTITNTSPRPLDLTPRFIGRSVGAFEVHNDDITPLAAGDSREFQVSFHPDSGTGNYTAGLQFGDIETAAFVQISAIHTPALEGSNEPPLHHIAQALGLDVNVGGKTLSLDSSAATIGSSIEAAGFERVEGTDFRITALARYSPPGEVTFGSYAVESGDKTPLGNLSATTEEDPDAHQSLMPPFSTADTAPEGTFGLYLAGPHYTSATNVGYDQKAKVTHTARVWPVGSLQNTRVENAYLVGFEEASNGDYQDALFLVEGVRAK